MDENILLRDGFQTGMTMEVLSDTNTPLFIGQISAMDDGTVTLKGDGNSPLPPGKEKKWVSLR